MIGFCAWSRALRQRSPSWQADLGRRSTRPSHGCRQEVLACSPLPRASTRTDVAKAAASLVLVLTQSGLGEIIAAVDGSRRIYQRMKTFVLTMMTRKIGIPVFLAGGVILTGVFVINPTLMVLLMFATDVATMSVSTDRVSASPVPDRWSVPSLLATALALGTLLLALSGAVYLGGRHLFGLGMAQTQTLVFVWLVFGGAQAVLCLTRARSWFWIKPHQGHMLLLISLIDILVVSVLATQGWLMSSISIGLVAAVLGLAFVFLIGADLLKVLLMHVGVRSSGPASTPGRPQSADAVAVQ